MAKLKLECVTGVVALSYLVLIPVAGILGYQKIRAMQRDVERMWDTHHFSDDMPESALPLPTIERLKDVIRGR